MQSVHGKEWDCKSTEREGFMEKLKKASEADQDYELKEVPLDKRRSFTNLAIVWTGYVFLITSMVAGGGLAAGLTFREIIITTILGNVFLGVLAILVSVIACKTGLTFALLTRHSFGVKGSRIASLFVPLVNLGWYTIQSATYGHLIAQILHLGSIGEIICMMISALVMGTFALAGMNAISILGYVAIPAVTFLSIATAVKAVTVAGGFSAVLEYIPANPSTIAEGATIVIGTWVFGTVACIADIMRYAKNTKEAVAASLTGLVGGNTLLVLCGAITAIAMGESDLTTVLLSMGLVIPSVILLTTNIFTTNAANLYSMSLNLANAFSMGRKKMLLVILAVSAALMVFKPYQIGFLFTFLDLLGHIVPPLAGIIFSDYYLVKKGVYKKVSDITLTAWNIPAWLTWAASLAIVYTLPMGQPSVTGIIAAVVIYTILMKVWPQKAEEGTGGAYEKI